MFVLFWVVCLGLVCVFVFAVVCVSLTVPRSI